MIDFSRRDLLAGVGASAAAFSIPESLAQQRLVLNDASKLNPTPVFGHWIAKSESEADVIARLRKELKDAAAAKRPVCVSAARHSMGGQSLPRNGQAITLDLNICEPDRAKKTFRVHAGTRWFEVIEHLARIGFSPAVMQSNSDFGVAATFSVNAHGWPVPYGPFGATVRSLRLMTGGRLHRHVLAQRKSRTVRPCHGRLWTRRHHSRSRSRHGREHVAQADVRADAGRGVRVKILCGDARPRDQDDVRPPQRRTRNLLQRSADDHLSQ